MTHTPPDFPAFPSRPIAGGHGRAYRVHGPTCLAAYWIADTETLRFAGVTEGFYLYAFYENGACGKWDVATSADELLRKMQTYRAAVEVELQGGRPVRETRAPSDCPPPPRDPEQFAGHIRPTYNREPAYELGRSNIPRLPSRADTREKSARILPMKRHDT